MTYKALSVTVGKEAADRIAKEGWNADLFSVLMGASGGPKWFILSHLDQLLFGDFLQSGTAPLSLLGSSIGSWRHAALTMNDPAAAVRRLEQGYLHQRYSAKPTAGEVTEKSRIILSELLGNNGAADLVNHPRFKTHIVTARGRGPVGTSSNPILAAGMGTAALSNVLSRQLLALWFQRVVFHNGAEARPEFNFHDFDTGFTTLNAGNITPALHASGSIPFVLTGEKNIAGAPAGQYWDGGIIDYHFDLGDYCGEGLILYPHFSADITTGWFDKFLPWRRSALHEAQKLVLLHPSETFTADLPLGKIPDRSDFKRLAHEDRVRYWETCIARGKALAEEFAELTAQGDPLRGVKVLA